MSLAQEKTCQRPGATRTSVVLLVAAGFVVVFVSIASNFVSTTFPDNSCEKVSSTNARIDELEREVQKLQSQLDLSKSDNPLTPSISAHCSELGITREIVAKSRLLGNTERWRRALQKSGQLKVAVLGGSVTAGHECAPHQGNKPNFACAWPAKLETMLRTTANANANQTVKIVNHAHGGQPSRAGLTQVMSLADYDIIIIHWTANDDNYKKFFGNHPESIKAVFETLIRTALALPKQPALILFEGFGLRLDEPIAEEMHTAVGNVYDIPIISTRTAIWNYKPFQKKIVALGGNADRVSPAHIPSMWHDKFACLMFENWKMEAGSHLNMSNWIDPLEREPAFGGTTKHCQKTFEASAFSNTLQDAAVHQHGWDYYADVPGKYGFISYTSGASLLIPVVPRKGMRNVLYVHYLKSYSEEWGEALVSTPGGVSATLQSRTDVHESQLDEVSLVLNATREFKVTITNVRGKNKIVEVFLFSCKG